MPTLHFLNVGQGDCTWIKHGNGNNTVVDVCNARETIIKSVAADSAFRLIERSEAAKGVKGNFRQKDYPVNPIDYMKSFGETSIFRFIMSHPDMDHMDGIEALFREFEPTNFWDTDNCKEIVDFNGTRFREEDWKFYRKLRGGAASSSPKRLTLYSGAKGAFYNQGKDGATGGNGIFVLAPTEELIADANECGDFNDCSYVILYKVGKKRVIIGGDSHDVTWEHILSQHRAEVENVDLLIAPHHGRDSSRSYDFLEVLRPKLTFFGVAPSEHLGYGAWRDRDLEVMTNNQGNCFVVDFVEQRADIHCTYKTFADVYRQEKYGKESFWDANLKSWYIRSI